MKDKNNNRRVDGVEEIITRRNARILVNRSSSGFLLSYIASFVTPRLTRTAVMGDNEPKDPTQDPLYGATSPETGTEPKVPQPGQPEQDVAGEGSRSGDLPEETANPLYGATPSEPSGVMASGSSEAQTLVPKDGAKGRLEATSRDRVRDLKAARENALAGSSSSAQAPLQVRLDHDPNRFIQRH